MHLLHFFLKPDHLPGPETLTVDEIDTILDRCQAYALRPEVDKRIKVNFVGSGEPLLAWKRIYAAIQDLNRRVPDHRLRFYTVTNGLPITEEFAAQMPEIGLKPSVSLDGPAWLHDRTRLRHNGRGSHDAVMRGIGILRDAGFDVAINTTLGRDVVDNLEECFDFYEEAGLDRRGHRARASPASASPATTSTTSAREGASRRDFRTNPAHCASLPASSANADVSPSGSPAGTAVPRRAKVCRTASPSPSAVTTPRRAAVHRS